HSKRQNRSLGFSSERLTRLRGAGAPFRPLFRPIPSYIVPGLKMIPFQLTAPNYRSRPTQGSYIPDKQRSIENKSLSVKSFAAFEQKSLWKSTAEPRLPLPPGEVQLRLAQPHYLNDTKEVS